MEQALCSVVCVRAAVPPCDSGGDAWGYFISIYLFIIGAKKTNSSDFTEKVMIGRGENKRIDDKIQD